MKINITEHTDHFRASFPEVHLLRHVGSGDTAELAIADLFRTTEYHYPDRWSRYFEMVGPIKIVHTEDPIRSMANMPTAPATNTSIAQKLTDEYYAKLRSGEIKRPGDICPTCKKDYELKVDDQIVCACNIQEVMLKNAGKKVMEEAVAKAPHMPGFRQKILDSLKNCDCGADAVAELEPADFLKFGHTKNCKSRLASGGIVKLKGPVIMGEAGSPGCALPLKHPLMNPVLANIAKKTKALVQPMIGPSDLYSTESPYHLKNAAPLDKWVNELKCMLCDKKFKDHDKLQNHKCPELEIE